jgi:hypothetical protein
MNQNSQTPNSRRKTKSSRATGGGKNLLEGHINHVGLIAAWRTDFWNTLNVMAPHVSGNLDENLCPIDGCAYLDLMQKRIGLALEYIILDTDELNWSGGVIRSFEFGHELVNDLVLEIILENPDDENFPQRLPGTREEKLMQLHACMIALIARGQSGRASELAQMADGLLWMFLNLENQGMLKPYYDKKFGPKKNQLKLLLYLVRCIQTGFLPTRRTLRIKVFNKDMDEGNLSRLLNGLEIAKFIPRDTNARKGDNEFTFYPIIRPLDGWPNGEYIKFIASKKIDQSQSENLVDAEPDTAAYCSIRLSGNPEMAQCEIRRIRESLGPAYWQLLIQFGMGELGTHQDLQVFVERLASIGLELK